LVVSLVPPEAGRNISKFGRHRPQLNYTIVTVGVVFLCAGIFWLVSTRKWFIAPRSQDDEAVLAGIEAAPPDGRGARGHVLTP